MSLTGARAALAAAGVAVLMQIGSLRHAWSPDDLGIIVENEAIHTLSGGWRAVLRPYWPAESHAGDGLYRPLVVLSYSTDWVVSGGSPAWFHAVNLVLHGCAVALFVALFVPWLKPAGALAAGLVFAVHPVHVEAVSQVAGRADLIAAIGLFGAVCAFRRFRGASSAGARRGWSAAVLLAVLAALLSKEHAAVAVGLLALDHLLDREERSADGSGVYLAVAAMTAGWLFVWDSVAGGYVSGAAAPLVSGPFPSRLANVLPAHLEVVRLLVWPAALAADYGPQVIPGRSGVSAAAMLGAVLPAAILGLGWMGRRNAPAVTFALGAAALSYLPVSNLLLPAGTVLGERTLYLAAGAPAAVAGWLLTRRATPGERKWVGLGLALWTAALAGRSWTRVGFWRDARTVVVEDFARHPESYRARVRLAGALESSGWLWRSLAEYTAARAVYPDPFIAVRSVPLALRVGAPRIAEREARASLASRPNDPALAQLLARALLAQGRDDAALEVTGRAVDRTPGSRVAARSHLEALRALDAPGWRVALAEGRLAWIEGRMIAATELLNRADFLFGESPGLLSAGACRELERTTELLRTMVSSPERLGGPGGPCGPN